MTAVSSTPHSATAKTFVRPHSSGYYSTPSIGHSIELRRENRGHDLPIATQPHAILKWDNTRLVLFQTDNRDHPIAVQSMTATRTQDLSATIRQVELLEAAGADVIRIAVDSKKDVEALAQIAPVATVPLSVDLQENYRLASIVAPHVQKIRYNPGHLYHHEKDKPIRDKVAFVATEAGTHDCALRVGVNCGSVDPDKIGLFPEADSISPMLAAALEHCQMLDEMGCNRYCVSLKDSNPEQAAKIFRRLIHITPPDDEYHQMASKWIAAEGR